MELRAGYKYTEIGLVPEDWEIKQLSTVVDFLDGLRKPIKSSDRKSGEYPYYGASGIIDYVNDFIFDDELILLGEDGENIISRSLPLVYRIKGKVWVNNHAHVLKPKEVIHIQYLTDFLESLDYSLLNSGTAQPKLNKQACLKILVAVPPLPEQIAIATALSDMDALIAQTEKLIEKKKAFKQGMMQQLLSPYDGERKLKGGWVENVLENVASIKARIGWQGLTTAEYRKSGNYLLVTGTEFKNGKIDWDACFYVDKDRYNQDRNIQVHENDVLVTKDGTIGKVAFVTDLPMPATLNSGVFVIRPINNSFYPAFFYFILLSEVFKLFLSQLSAGSTINHLYQKDFVSFRFFSPASLKEQKSIATFLNAVECEIQNLNTKLQKQMQIKQAMMQSLLTGKIRIYKPEYEKTTKV
jgi:type I restriction enzyme, S subunit